MASATILRDCRARADAAAITLSRTRGSGSSRPASADRLVETAQIGQRPDRLDARLGPLRCDRQRSQGRDRGRIPPVQQQPLGGVALPAAGTVERGDEPGRDRAGRAAESAAGFLSTG